MIEIKIGGKTIPLFYSTFEMIAIQKEIGCTAYQLRDEVFGVKQEDEDDPMSIQLEVVTDPERTRKLGTLLAILGNAGLEENGEKADLTEKWILRKMKPNMIMTYAIAAMAAITEGNRPEKEAQDKEDGPVDQGLEEENAKKQPGN